MERSERREKLIRFVAAVKYRGAYPPATVKRDTNLCRRWLPHFSALSKAIS